MVWWVGLILRTFPLLVRAEVLQRLILLSARVHDLLTAQCDLFRLAEAEGGRGSI